MDFTINESSQFFDAEMPDHSDQGLFFEDAYAADQLYGEADPSKNPFPSAEETAEDPPRTSIDSSTSLTSPESSSQDSSSDQSTRHGRKLSSRSSHSPDIKKAVTEEGAVRPSKWRGGPISRSQAEKPNVATVTRRGDLESSNRAMEADFDFDSAANTPGSMLSGNSTTSPVSGGRFLAIPQDSPAIGSVAMSVDSSSFSNTMPLQEHSPAPPNFNTNSYTQMVQSARGSPTDSDELMDMTYFHHRMPHASAAQPVAASLADPTAKLDAQQSETLLQVDVQDSMDVIGQLGLPAQLSVQVPVTKTRVETQTVIRIGLHPFPEDIKRLHLPRHTIAKSKLLARQSPAMEADMLELSTMVVCTSAMRTPGNLERALEIAAHGSDRTRASTISRKSSLDGGPLKATEGGEVMICAGCMDRERKRANRKKTKKPEEEDRWLKDEAKRILMFNTHEIQEWHDPSSNNQSLKAAKMKATATADMDQPPMQLPEGARQIDLPTRIACYCRHCHEKEGFRIIFTVTSHRGQLVAQGISNSIMITDDHKAAQNHTSMQGHGNIFIPRMELYDGNNFAQPSSNMHNGPQRNAYSTPDLQALGLQHGSGAGHFTATPFAVPQPLPQAQSSAMPPNNLSRQPSPSLPTNPSKRRKGSGGVARIPNQLQMTRIQQEPYQTSAALAWPITSPSSGSPFAPTFPTGSRHMPQHSAPWISSPTTPDNEPNFNTERTFSLGTTPQTRPAFSLPSSARASRASSPNLGPLQSPLGHGQLQTPAAYGRLRGSTAHVQNLQDQAAFMAGEQFLSERRPAPIILKTIPSEGPKSGGIEVSVLGRNFYKGIQVMFGTCAARTVTVWGKDALVCILPVALHAGPVEVTLKQPWDEPLSSPPPSDTLPVTFMYRDNNETAVMHQVVQLLNKKMNGNAYSYDHFAQQLHSYLVAHDSGGQFSNELNMTGQNHMSHKAGGEDLEAKILKLLDLIDLDESPHPSNLNLQQRSNGQCILHTAASLGFLRLVAGLLARGADPDLRDRGGHTPLHMAAVNGHVPVVRKLLAAGADAEITSIRGFTAADMATTNSVYRVFASLSLTRSRSFRRMPWQRSRASSLSSITSRRELFVDNVEPYSEYAVDGDDEASYTTQPSGYSTPAHPSIRSRRNSVNTEAELMTPTIANPGSLIAWRDSLALQIQHFQQNVSRTFPNLQLPNLPNLPTMPNLPNLPNFPENYQAGFMMRHLSPFMPRSTASSDDGNRSDSRESETTLPAYDELFPGRTPHDNDTKTSTVVQAADDVLAEYKHTAATQSTAATSSLSERKSKPVSQTLTIGRGEATPEELERLRAAHAQRMKGLKSDFKLYIVWIPILVFVVFTVMWNKAPDAIRVTKEAYDFMLGQSHD